MTAEPASAPVYTTVDSPRHDASQGDGNEQGQNNDKDPLYIDVEGSHKKDTGTSDDCGRDNGTSDKNHKKDTNTTTAEYDGKAIEKSSPTKATTEGKGTESDTVYYSVPAEVHNQATLKLESQQDEGDYDKLSHAISQLQNFSAQAPSLSLELSQFDPGGGKEEDPSMLDREKSLQGAGRKKKARSPPKEPPLPPPPSNDSKGDATYVNTANLGMDLTSEHDTKKEKQEDGSGVKEQAGKGDDPKVSQSGT